MPIVSLRFTQRHSKALNNHENTSKLHRFKYYYPRPDPHEVRAKSPPTCMCILSCVDVCFHAGLPQSLYNLLVLMLDSHGACISASECMFHVNARLKPSHYAGLPRSLSVIRLYEKIGFE